MICTKSFQGIKFPKRAACKRFIERNGSALEGSVKLKGTQREKHILKNTFPKSMKESLRE